MRKKTVFILIILLIAVLLIIYQRRTGKNKYTINNESGILIGAEGAENSLVLYTSIYCDSCRELNNNIHELLFNEIKEGNLKIILKLTDSDFYKVKNEIFYDYQIISECYNDLTILKRGFTNNLDVDEIKKRSEMFDIIQSEIENNDINVLPTFIFNNEKYVGIYTEQEMINILLYMD